jgi:hypothetical protein
VADTPAADLPEEPAPSPRRRPLLVLWGVLAVLAVAVGGIVVAGGGDDDPPKLAIALGAGGSLAEADAATAGGASSMAAWVHYVAGADLPALGGTGPAFRLSGDVTLEGLREVAAVLGVDGHPVEEPPGSGAWAVTGSDGSLLGAGPHGGGGWWYTSGSLTAATRGDGGGTSASPAGCAPDGACPEPFPAPEPFVPPADLPTEQEARRIALDLFEHLGVDVAGAQVTVEGPGDAWYVSLEPPVEGLVVAGYAFHAAVGSKGEVVSAGGLLNRPTKLGDYPTVDTGAAVDRLNEQSSGFGDGREPGVAIDAAECATTGGAEPAPHPGSVSADGGCAPAAPAGPTEVVLHEAERILVVVPAFDDTSEGYLVPGYRFRGDEIGWVDVVAVDDDSLLPPPVEDQPLPEPGERPVDGPAAVDGAPGCAPPSPGPDGAAPDICLDPGAPPTDAGRSAGATGGGTEPSAPLDGPDTPVSSPPVGEP